MALDDHPQVFRFEGHHWVSAEPREVALAGLVAQRRWDASNARLQRWWVAIVIGAIVGTAATLAVGTSADLAPALYLLLLPIGFGIGAVLGALVNKWFNAPDAQHASLPTRPVIAQLTRIPSRVARNSPPDATAEQIIEWSNRGFVT